MSAPPIGMMMQNAERQREPTMSQKSTGLWSTIEADDEEDQRQPERDVDDVAGGQRDRLAAHAAGQFEEGDDRAGEGDGADGDAERHFDQALLVDVAFAADAEGRRRIEGARRHQHRGHADQRVEGGDQFRHRGHRHPARDHRADAAAERDAGDHQAPGEAVGRRMRGQRGDDGDASCRSCRTSCRAGSIRARQPAQRQDEQDAGDEIEQRDEIGAHARRSYGWPARNISGIVPGHDRHFFFF